MDARRAQDLLKHITQDEDYGLKAMQKASLAECISMVNNVLPECQKRHMKTAMIMMRAFFKDDRKLQSTYN